MKRLRPATRRTIIQGQLKLLARDWLCRYGQWNRDKLLSELEHELASQRRNGG